MVIERRQMTLPQIFIAFIASVRRKKTEENILFFALLRDFILQHAPLLFSAGAGIAAATRFLPALPLFLSSSRDFFTISSFPCFLRIDRVKTRSRLGSGIGSRLAFYSVWSGHWLSHTPLQFKQDKGLMENFWHQGHAGNGDGGRLTAVHK